jgi:radical SAM protein with 4Fe4S-binding SPASM domain
VKASFGDPFYVYSSSNGHGNHILFHATQPRWMVVNDTGLKIARLLEKTKSLEHSAHSLAERYGIPEDKAGKDVASVYNLLKESGFLNGTRPAPQARSPSLKTMFVHLTTRCNLNCPHCYFAKGANAVSELPFPAVIGLIDTLSANGGRSITLSGGEPLLYARIREVIDYARHRLSVRLLTNGVLIDREWARFLSGGDVSVQISIDGSKPEVHDRIRGKGTFVKSMQALAYLKEAGLGPKVNLSTTVMSRNIDDLPNIISLAEKHRVSPLRFLPVRRRGRGESQWASVGAQLTTNDYVRFFRYNADRFAQGERSLAVSSGSSGFLLDVPEDISDDGIWCPVGRSLIVDTNGDAYPCVLMMDDAWKLGNIYYHDPRAMIQSEAMKRICGILAERRFAIEKCSQCPWRNLCQAGCMGQALEHRGTVWDTDAFCDYRREAYTQAFERILSRRRD